MWRSRQTRIGNRALNPPILTFCWNLRPSSSNLERYHTASRSVRLVSAFFSANFHFCFGVLLALPGNGALCLQYMVMSKSRLNYRSTPLVSNVTEPIGRSTRTRPAWNCATNALKAPSIRANRSSAFTCGPVSIAPNLTYGVKKQKRCGNSRSVMPCVNCNRKPG